MSLPRLAPAGCSPATHRLAKRLAGAALLCCAGAPVLAQTVPDAGALRQQLEPPRLPQLPPQGREQLAPPKPMTSLGGATVTLRAIRFAGNSLLSEAQLAPVVAPYLQRPLDFAQLQNIAIAVANAYRQAGWVVRAYLPQQDLEGGVLTVEVVEARFGKLRQHGGGQRVDAATVAAIVGAAQASGQPVHGDRLDRALLLIGDLPGVDVSGALAEGEQQAQTDLLLELRDGPLLSGEASVDNGGARSTGQPRLNASINLNGPLHQGDLASLAALHSAGSDYLRAAYLAPLGGGGWRMGASASYLRYRLVGDFAGLDARGTSAALGIEASYPLLRARLHNLYLSLNADHKRFDNRSGGVIATRYRSDVASASFSGNLFDGVGGGGANSASVILSMGDIDLAGSPNAAADAASVRSAGAFRKVRFALAREQVLAPALSLYAALSGQSSNRNLDSSEKFYLGGAGGVRAYPVNEGAGSEGLLANLEARLQLPANLRLSGFFDWGAVRVNHDNDIRGAALPNGFNLKGAGLALAWSSAAGYSVKASLARRLGDNPNPTAAGRDQDGTLERNRLWLQASLPF